MSKLHTYLRETGLTQVQFAKLVGCDQTAISKMGSATPSFHPSFALAARIEAVTGGAVPIHSWPEFSVLTKMRHPTRADPSHRDTGCA